MTTTEHLEAAQQKLDTAQQILDLMNGTSEAAGQLLIDAVRVLVNEAAELQQQARHTTDPEPEPVPARIDYAMYSDAGNWAVATEVGHLLALIPDTDEEDLLEEWVLSATSCIQGRVDHPEVNDTAVREAIDAGLWEGITARRQG